MFTETTGEARNSCASRFHYGHLIDVTSDGRLDFLCADEAAVPAEDLQHAAAALAEGVRQRQSGRYLPAVPKTVDSVIADFNNDGRMDMFVLGGVQLRPSAVAQQRLDALRSAVDWTASRDSGSSRRQGHVRHRLEQAGRAVTTTDFSRIEIGAGGFNPTSVPFMLDPANPRVRGMPPAPTRRTRLPVMQIGYDADGAAAGRSSSGPSSRDQARTIFSEAYLQVDSTAAISELAGTGFWPSDKPATADVADELLRRLRRRDRRGGPRRAAAVRQRDRRRFRQRHGRRSVPRLSHAAPAISPNVLYENLGDGTFRKVERRGRRRGPGGRRRARAARARPTSRGRRPTTTSTASSTCSSRTASTCGRCSSAARTSCSATRATVTTGSRSTSSARTRSGTRPARACT